MNTRHNNYLDSFGKTPLQQAQEKETQDNPKTAKNQGDLILNALAALITEVKSMRKELAALEKKLSRR